MRTIMNRFRDCKIKHKIMYIFILIGTIPMMLLGIFTYHQERVTLIEKEKKAVADSLSQGADQLESQVLVYDNLSDYIAFNQPISEVIGGEYASNYQMYEQFTKTVDPVLSSLKYFNPNIKQITVYINKNIVKHDMTVASLTELVSQKWYKEKNIKLEQKVQWVIDQDEKLAISVRTMPILAQNGQRGVMLLSVNYDNLFSGFQEITQANCGLYVLDADNHPLFEKNNFSGKNKKDKLSVKKLLKETSNKQTDYMVVSQKVNENGWKVVAYSPNGMVKEATHTLLFLLVGILAICLFASYVANKAFSYFVVRDIERLRDNMQAVENGNRELTVTSQSKDEVGGLIRGFGSMLSEINRLINQVYEGKLTLRKSEMRALQAQINPHFLYNSLSLINWKAIAAGQEDISRITLALSSFYRTSLNRGKNVLTIEKELENMKSYLEIQLCMHDDDFDVLMDVDDSILQYATLNLLLQPLVENAIDHGIDLKEEGRGYIKIIGRGDENTIYLTVEDNGVGMEPEVLDSVFKIKTKGYGVRNVNERIQLFYGEQYCLKVESEVGKGTRCTITIPKQESASNK